MGTGADSRRVVQITCGHAGNRPDTRGSGYRITATAVLTAAHVIEGAASIRVRGQAGQPGDWTVTGRGETLGDDTALIHIPPPDAMAVDLPPPTYGGLGTRPAVLQGTAVGYPLFQLVGPGDDPGIGSSVRPYRDTAHVPGEVAAIQGLRSGRLTFHVNATYAPPPSPVRGRSPWEGMSGAAVWVNECLVGVICQDQDPDQPIRLIAYRLEHMLAGLPAGQSARVRADLGLRPGQDLVNAAADARSHAVLLDYRQEALLRLPVDGVKGRGSELELMRRFCAGEDALLVWRADAWSGKSALMAAFAAEPPGGVDLVCFFVNSQIPDQRDSQGFLASVNRQLEALLGLAPGTREPTPGAAEGAFWRLVDDATADSLSLGRALVLLIDGLDEDAALASVTGQRSIASLLSGNLPGGLHIIAATRPYPKVLREIGTGSHPSGAFRDLPPSPYAVVSREQAAAEIDSAVLKEGLDTDVAGFLTAARSGLTLRDFTALTGRPPGIILSMLRTSFRRSIRPEPGADRDREGEGAIFVFSHGTLRGLVQDDNHLGSEIISQYVDRIHSWAERCRAAGWNEKTPDYLVTGYPALLVETEDLPRLLDYALDSDRQEWLRERLGNDLAAMSELEQAERLNRAAGLPDLGKATRLAKSRDTLRDRSSSLSAAALTVLAGSDWRRAAALARGAGDGSVAVVAGELVRTAGEDLGPASTVTHLIVAPSYSAPALCELALAHHGRGQLAPAEETAASALDAAGKVGDFSARVTCLTRVAEALTTVGLKSVAGEALAQAAEAAREIVDDRSLVACLMRLAASLASAEGPGSAQPVVNKALAIARGVDDPARAAALLTAIASSDGAGLVSQDDRASALRKVRRAAESISSVQDRPRALAAIALAQVHFAVPYESSLREAIKLAAQVEYLKFHAEILEACATVLYSAGKGERAARLLEEAVAVAGGPAGRWDEYTWWRRADTLISLACTQARQGLHQAARDTVTTRLLHERQKALSAIAEIQIDGGVLDEVAATIQLISDPDRYIPAAGQLTCALARNTDPSASSKLDEFVAMLTRPDAGQNVAGGLGYAALAAHYLGREERALELAEMSVATQRPRGPLERVEVFVGIGRAYAKAGNKERAIQHLKEAMRTAQGLDAGDQPTLRQRYDQTIAAVAAAEAAIEQYSPALAAIAQLKSSTWPAWEEKPKAYIAVASLQAQAGQTTDADTTFSLAAAATLQRYEPLEAHRTGNMFTSIVLAQARIGRQSAAWATAEELRGLELGLFWHGSYHADRCLAKLAEYYASASRHDDARKTAERIRDASLRSEIEQSLSDGTKTGAAGAASPGGQADKPDDWESQARQMLGQSEPKTLAYDPGSPAGQTFLELAETARVHGSHELAIALVAAAFALLPCHKVLEAACRVEPSLGTLLEELEPWQ